MLVLSRGRNEKIIVGKPGETVEIVVVEIRGDKVRLGIKAPREIPVHRSEVFELEYGDQANGARNAQSGRGQ